MKSGKQTQALTGMPTKQKITIGVTLLVLIIILWQIVGLFGGGSPQPTKTAVSASAPGAASAQSHTPQQLPMFTQAQLEEREAALVKLQQDTQDKYIKAVNELQLLKVEREIAENNKAIMSAKLDTVTAQKDILGLLTPSVPQATAPGSFAPGLVLPTSGALQTQAPQQEQPAVSTQEAPLNYSVVSVSQLRYKWSAVLGSGNNLYQVSVGDILPVDRSKVISIDKTGVVLEKDGVHRKMSLVPII